jgi:hypothetical protein
MGTEEEGGGLRWRKPTRRARRRWRRRGVRHRRLLQISGRAGSAEREMGRRGGSAQACHMAEEERQKEGVARGRQLGHGAGMAPGGAVGGDSAWSRLRRAGEQGRERGKRGSAAAGWPKCGRETGKRGSAAAGHRRVGPSSTVLGSVVQTRF